MPARSGTAAPRPDDARPEAAPGAMRPDAAPTLGQAADRIVDWGFLANPDLPDRPGPASLIVALRDVPTLRHYDPEMVSFWSTDGDRGVRRLITRQTTMPCDRALAWGEIRISDRLGVSNEYMTFGGRCQAGVIDGVTIVVFTSDAPLLRRGGHSQGWDEGADAIGAFFGRLLVTVDYVPGFEARLATATPLACYAAFLQERLALGRQMGERDPDERSFGATVRTESVRLRRDHPVDWDAGTLLLAEVERGIRPG
jgi:hypothetical protein